MAISEEQSDDMTEREANRTNVEDDNRKTRPRT